MAWLGQDIRLGVWVREKDGRHRGLYTAVVSGLHRVIWENGWRTDFEDLGDLVRWEAW